MTWVDSHCHVPADEAEALVAEAGEAGVGELITVGCDRATSLEALDLAVGSRTSMPRLGCTLTRRATASTRSSICSMAPCGR